MSEENEVPTYTMKMYCQNCYHDFELRLPKGVPCCGFYECPRCGLKDARKR